MKKPILLWGGIAASAVLLVCLMVIRARWPELLDISSAWIGIAVLPIVVGLLAGGYVKTFKGFGIEVEAALAGSVTADLSAVSASDYDPFAEAEESAMATGRHAYFTSGSLSGAGLMPSWTASKPWRS